ncbi:MAG: DUF1272 domain-containing protein [Kangiellaceae bacterium]|nr:DUF1272 domain-containing protein [Kangiellaceae bacterium]
MLELRPTCENCRKALPPHSTEAMICSYECTYCRDCVEHILLNVCPNCGGGFSPRPIRPQQEYVAGVSLQHQPASTKEVFKPVTKAHHLFAIEIQKTQPENR